jgi:hypothetical protein
MSMTPGLSPNIRQGGLGGAEPAIDDDAQIDVALNDENEKTDDDSENVLQIEHEDGSVTISLDGKALNETKSGAAKGWFDNLVDDIDQNELTRIAEDLLRGVDEDINSRRDWIEERALGVKLLGLKIEIPGLQGAADGAPVEGMSKVRHPLLLEAVLRFQANARSEMLPTDGPLKIRNDNNRAELNEDQLANALERDLNHYLTSVATEYYPDTDRMLLMVGFGGTQFKKIYFCPLRNRPVSETVDADDLIVNNNATDLANAKRITHRIMMRPSVVKRMQILGVYHDVELGSARAPKLDSLQLEEKSQQGVSAESKPDDYDREIYECYCELDIKGYEHKWKNKISGLEIPYRVTIDVSSRTVLSIVRNYDDTKQLPEPRETFVEYTFVPGMGFYGIGLLHILGNTTNAITAAWREMLDNGMYANFPGFLMAKSGSRQNTNIFRVPPGGGAQIDTGGLPISQAVMPLPYQTGGMPALMQLTDSMAQTGMRIGGTSEQQVGEGRAEAPVGTTLAMIEQATKVMNAVHKRMHASQAREFKLLVECFREHPEAFWQRKGPSKTNWDEQTFLRALQDVELVPQADPNTASHGQRVMKIMALKQLQAANPSMYDPIAVDRAALQAIGWNNPEQFLVPQGAQQQPPPELLKMQADAKATQQKADAEMIEAQAKAKEVDAKIQQGAFAPRPAAGGLGGGETSQHDAVAKMTAQAKLMDAETNRQQINVQLHASKIEDQNRDLDRQSRERVEMLSLAKDVALHPESVGAIKQIEDGSEI